MDSPEAELIAMMRADADQQTAAAGELARYVVTFRTVLVDGGMSAPVADQLAAAYFGTVLGLMGRSGVDA